MKKYLLIIALFTVITFPSFAQETRIPRNRVPAAVLNAFKAEYPKAKIIGTLKESKHGMLYYEIESRDGKMKRNVIYTPAGVVSEIEDFIPAKLLPNAIQTVIAKDHPKAKIRSVEKNIQGAAIKYEVLFQEGRKKFEVIYSPDGNILPN